MPPHRRPVGRLPPWCHSRGPRAAASTAFNGGATGRGVTLGTHAAIGIFPATLDPLAGSRTISDFSRFPKNANVSYSAIVPR